jgi:hypothetical protein
VVVVVVPGSLCAALGALLAGSLTLWVCNKRHERRSAATYADYYQGHYFGRWRVRFFPRGNGCVYIAFVGNARERFPDTIFNKIKRKNNSAERTRIKKKDFVFDFVFDFFLTFLCFRIYCL